MYIARSMTIYIYKRQSFTLIIIIRIISIFMFVSDTGKFPARGHLLAYTKTFHSIRMRVAKIAATCRNVCVCVFTRCVCVCTICMCAENRMSNLFRNRHFLIFSQKYQSAISIRSIFNGRTDKIKTKQRESNADLF